MSAISDPPIGLHQPSCGTGFQPVDVSPGFADLVRAELRFDRNANCNFEDLPLAERCLRAALANLESLVRQRPRQAKLVAHALVRLAVLAQRTAEDLCLLAPPLGQTDITPVAQQDDGA